MIKLLFICFTLFASNVFADEVYNSDTAKGIQSIYWLNKNQGGAIVYAKHHGFVQLKSFIDTTIITSNQVKNSKFNTEEAEQLLLMSPVSKKWLVVYFTEDQLSYNGQTYSVDSNLIEEMIKMNNYRISKGDLISSQSLNRAKKSFGLLLYKPNKLLNKDKIQLAFAPSSHILANVFCLLTGRYVYKDI